MKAPIQREQLAEGLAFSTIADSRFKTNLLTVNFVLPLSRENITKFSLLPLVLEKCWEEAPTAREFSKQCSRLYGASVSSGAARLGNSALLTFSFSAIDSAYALAGEDMMQEGAKILMGILLRPIRKNGFLEPENLELQKKFLSDTILADINEKRSYAIGKILQKMFEGEPAGMPRYGFLEDIPGITPEDASSVWDYILDVSQIEIIHVGCGDPSGAKALFAKAFAHRTRHPVPMLPLPMRSAPEVPRKITEYKSVIQSKLCMGFQTGINAYSEDLSAMRLMNAILGGTSTSRLFTNVREKRSLCYYCASRFDRTRGILMIDSGVEKAKAEETKQAVLEEIQAVCRGEFTDEEMEFARLSLQNGYNSISDSAWGMDSFYLTQILLGIHETPEDQIEKLNRVTREQICAAAKKLKLDTVYLLTGTEEGDAV